MRTTTTIRIHDNLSARQTRVTMRATNHELTRRVHMILDVSLEEVLHPFVIHLGNHSGNQHMDDIFPDASQHLLISFLLRKSILRSRHNKLVVLGAHHDGVHALRLAIIPIFNRHLTLGIRSQIRHFLAVGTDIGHHLSLPADVSQHLQDAMREVERQRHTVLRLVRGITKHHALITRTLIFRILAFHASVNVTTLFMDGIQHATTLPIKLIRGFRVTNPVDGFTCNLLKIHIGIAFHFTSQHHLPRRDQRFASHLRLRVVCQQIVQHSIADLVSHLVGMSLRHRFRCK